MLMIDYSIYKSLSQNQKKNKKLLILFSYWCQWHDTIFFFPSLPLFFSDFCHSFSCQCHDMVASARMSFARACSHALGSAIRKGLFMWCKFILTFSFLMLYLGGEINSFLSYLILPYLFLFQLAYTVPPINK